MVYRGRMDHGVVVLEGDARPPEGAIVDVVVVQTDVSSNPAESIYRLDELATPSGIPDLALNLDHYLYGHPKVDDAE
jgi:hypothetical protein